MKVIVAGGRDLVETKELFDFVTEKLISMGATQEVCGGAKGGDQIGAKAARLLGIQVVTFPANWHLYGKSAGMIRNQRMADYADALIALPGGKGTDGMIKLAQKKGMEIVKYA